MSRIEIQLPAMGEGIIEATITRWLVAIGNEVTIDQSIVEIATDKVDSEIPSPVNGRIKELLFSEGETPQVGQVIAIIEAEGQDTQKTDNNQEKPKPETGTKIVKEVIEHKEEAKTVEPNNGPKSTIHLSPLVRTIVKKEGISDDEIGRVQGTGVNGRITRNDILAYVEKRNSITEKPKAPKPIDIDISTGDVEIIHMDRMRKLIAEHMVMSKQTSAHVTSFIEADVTNLMAWRNSEKESFLKREGQKLTLTHLFVEATVKAIKQYPIINSSVDNDKIIVRKNIGIGIATALPNGNLIVPVVANADKLNLSGIVEKVNDLAQRARNNKLQPNEIQGGTFTITNLGMFDTLSGTPIINQPQVAILAIGAIKKRVVVIESENGDTIGIRQIAILSLSYDHRVVDGALGGMFLKAVKENIENH
ncbi:MAG: dihydrolipoamide acetyltransferase family protein [Bacteroidales bacterium]|jgi:2-oxoglutarate dehydrogenase E2 component (dihydrolipoamide succinyltransferase)|nr:dihydrolipoamide acetyltransferase family protein [Bacteroidales bacterium]MDD4384344.1 dihydrolipoamide acetyltransferase family protein [Bacteroidales bacterium]MDY0198144.1 dihydrolipoamide acetyltransferase family protein [Tenuifilaceae bacterium]